MVISIQAFVGVLCSTLLVLTLFWVTRETTPWSIAAAAAATLLFASAVATSSYVSVRQYRARNAHP